MAKVFTITEGLENMGAMKTGGQGSVYKGRRIGEIITAIKLLPTPIYSESSDDKNYIAFQNEVQKLKKVNEDPNPHVVKILSSGITGSGNFPFIEMEYIEGPDLEDLLKPPHDKIFTIKEVLKVAEQLSSALAHCHKVDVRHGDIKSNNVKYSTKTGNYVLLDFGLAVMSDEQRRTSLRHAGAIEFMAPEQNDGVMLLQTDIYSFGVILFELLAGTVPFPLNDRGETGRNNVMVAHMETPPPDLLVLRQQSLPETWSPSKKEQEMQLPDWLISTIYKCLEKKPGDRFANGVYLYDHICENAIRTANKSELNNARITFLEEENKRLRLEREELQQQLFNYQHHSTLVKGGSSPVTATDNNLSSVAAIRNPSLFSLKNGFAVLLVLLVIAAGVYFFITRNPPAASVAKPVDTTTTSIPEPTENAETRKQLQTAARFLNDGKLVEAFTIYSNLSRNQVPEAMYQYAKLALQNKNENITCVEAFDLLKRASEKGYAPAKRTLGFLYAFADDTKTLQQSNFYERCRISKNTAEGARLLMEATLLGDTTATRLLDQLNVKR